MKLNDFSSDKIFVKVHSMLEDIILCFSIDYYSNSRHYALCCLTAITFTSEDNDLANRLIKIYFALFRVNFVMILYLIILFILLQLLSVKEDVSSKFFAILLGGVTRAISFAKGNDE
jgi:hypothetical protein